MTAPATARTTRTVDLPHGPRLTVDTYGTATGRAPVLLLHGGAGPRTMSGLAAALCGHTLAVAPTHPGFDSTPRPDWCDSVADLATVYLDLLDELDLTGVLVVGNSVGGWIAAEMALRDTRGRVGALTLLNAVGVHAERPADQVVDPRTLPPAEMTRLSFADPAFRPDFAAFTDEQCAVAAADQRTLAVYGGPAFSHDPELRGRLHRVTVPVLVLWGEEDGIATTAYGRGYADAFPDARFVAVPGAAHFPQIERPVETVHAIAGFADSVAGADAAR
ncbi:alpha/beta hydrolase [Streptomyces sp. NPDC096080]|uniref:alpha/beta fold hydrolase n=1 Tax=Streptomyces sp. NPDC096080 TaxID=3156693 RepID=UPI00332A17A6